MPPGEPGPGHAGPVPLAPFDCVGAPRDLGLDQGRACAAAVRAAHAGSPAAVRARARLGWSDARTSRVLRDVARHFPRHWEALSGLARGARVPRAWLAQRLAHELLPPGDAPPVATGGGRAACSAPRELALRRCRPEGGLRTLEVARPWSPAALAGVNEAGLAAVARVLTGEPRGPCAAPGALLLSDCLHRFASVEAALEWCLARPGGGRVELVFGDARGGAAVAVAIDGAERAVRRPEGTSEADFEKAVRDLAAAGSPGAPLAILDPGARRLGIAPGTGPPHWLDV